MTQSTYHERRSDGEVAAEERERSDAAALAGLFSELTRETTLLVRQEVALARAEMDEKVHQVQRGVISLSGGAAVAYAGFLFLALAGTLGLIYVMPAWAAALIVGAVLAIIGGALLAKGRSDARPGNLRPDRTIETTRQSGRAMTGHRREEEHA